MRYTFAHADGSTVEQDFPMGFAPRSVTVGGERYDRVYNANFGFTYGREDFHGPTIGERVEQQLIDKPDAVHVGSRWI